MALTTTLLNTSQDMVTTYAGINDLIGQLKAIILADSNVTIISDNNPSSGTARAIVYQIGNAAHYYKILANNYSTIKFSNRNLANSSDLSYSTLNVQNVTFKLMYSSRTHLLHMSSVNAWLFLGFKAISNQWYTSTSFYNSTPDDTYAYSSRCFHNSNDNAISSASPNYNGYQDASGKIYIVPSMLYYNNLLIDTVPQCSYTLSSSLAYRNWYNDGALNYYYTASGYLYSE